MKVTLDGMSSQCSSVQIRSATLLVRGSNRISHAAARRTPDNGLRRHFGAPAKKSVTVVEACQDQRPHQDVRGLDGERPTDRPELADVKVTRPHQPGDVLTKITNLTCSLISLKFKKKATFKFVTTTEEQQV